MSEDTDPSHPTVLSAAAVEAQVSSSSKLKLSYVQEGMGCGCSMSYNSSDSQNNKHLLIVPMDDDAYVTIDEKKLQLRLIAESKEKACRKSRRSVVGNLFCRKRQGKS